MNSGIRAGGHFLGAAIVAVFAFIAVSDVEPSRSAAPAGDSALAFRDVRVFDGERARTGLDVLVEGDRITGLGPGLDIPPRARVVDGGGHTLLPGLIDAHTHTFARRMLVQAAVFGVTTELDMFTSPDFMQQAKTEQADGEAVDRAHLYSSGVLATAPGGHGTEYGFRIPTLEGPEPAESFVEDRLEEGSDYLKIVYGSSERFPTISRETLRALVEAAHEKDLLAVVHIETLENARHAFRAGADGLAHAFLDRRPDSAFVELAAASSGFMVPTLSVLESLAGRGGGATLARGSAITPYLTARVTRNLEQSFPSGESGERPDLDVALEAVRRLHEAGVPILAGTDAPNPGTAHGASMHRELELLVEAGLEPVEALRAATSVPARTFGLQNRGRIAAGMRADLLLVEGDPTADITATREIRGVWKAGRRIDREAFRKEVSEEAARADAAKDAPPPPGAESGLVSDFDGDSISPRFGSGWSVSTDSIMGGESKTDIALVEGGADGSPGSLLVEGKIAATGPPFRWAGAVFVPGSGFQEPANLSAFDEIAFRARGDGGTYRLMVFSRSAGAVPAQRTFVAGAQWEQHVFPLSAFDTDGHDLVGILFAGGPDPGEFRLRIDDVRFR